MVRRFIHITLWILLSINLLVAQNNLSRPGIPVRIEDYQKESEKALRNLENKGYPFATTTLQCADVHQDMSTVMLIDTNQFITFDSIVLKGDVKLSKGFLYPYLGLRRGTAYNESLMQQVNRKLTELSCATVIRDAEVSFVEDKAYLYVYLDSKRVNQFDGYIGIIPTNEITGKMAVNGELTLALQNVFKQGESIGLHWYSSEHSSQHLNLSVKFPYLFKTRFGIRGDFLLDKQDTSFLTLNYHIGLPYSFVNNSYIEPYFDYSSSIVLDSNLRGNMRDTICRDYQKSLYGLKVHYRKLDYLYNPRKGIDLQGDISVGRRKFTDVNKLENSNSESPEATYRVYVSAQGYIPIGQHLVITPKVQFGTPVSGTVYYNELRKIGGIGGIRGFNPNDIAASTFLLYSAELRYLFGKKSYANLFFDGGTYEQNMPDFYRKDSPFGFGAGIHLAVKSGIFYLEYALGRQLGNPIQLKTGKIHFGVQVEF